MFGRNAWLVSVAIAVQIKVLDFLWDIISKRLTHWEQHVTIREFCAARARKLFRMKCVNAFSNFMFVAFVQPWLDSESCATSGYAGDCRSLLGVDLIQVFVIYIGFGIIGWPWAYGQKVSHVVLKIQSYKGGWTPSHMEKEASMPDYDDDELTSDFMEVLFPLALVAWFGMSKLCWLTFLCLLSNVLQHRTDAMKLTFVFRRPFPGREEGIGMWRSVFAVICILAMFFNVGLVLTQARDPLRVIRVFMPIVLAKLQTVELQWLAYLLLANIILTSLFVLQRFVMIYIPDVSAWTALQKRRQDLQRARLFSADILHYEEDIKIYGKEVFETLRQARNHLLPDGSSRDFASPSSRQLLQDSSSRDLETPSSSGSRVQRIVRFDESSSLHPLSEMP